MADIQRYSFKAFMNFSLSERSIYYYNKINSIALWRIENENLCAFLYGKAQGMKNYFPLLSTSINLSKLAPKAMEIL